MHQQESLALCIIFKAASWIWIHQTGWVTWNVVTCANEVTFLPVCLQDYAKTTWLIFTWLVGRVQRGPTKSQLQFLHGSWRRFVLSKCMFIITWHPCENNMKRSQWSEYTSKIKSFWQSLTSVLCNLCNLTRNCLGSSDFIQRWIRQALSLKQQQREKKNNWQHRGVFTELEQQTPSCQAASYLRGGCEDCEPLICSLCRAPVLCEEEEEYQWKYLNIYSTKPGWKFPHQSL